MKQILTSLLGGVAGAILLGGFVVAGWDGNGNVTVVHDWTDDRDAGIKIQASRMDAQDEDMRGAIENAIAKDGQNAATGNLPMGGFKHDNVADGNERDEYASVGQVQDADNTFIAASGTADALTASFSPAITALVDGMTLSLRAAAANTSTTPTLNVNGLGAKTITRQGNQPLSSSAGNADIRAAGFDMVVRYNSSNDVFELLNPAAIGPPIGSIMMFAGATSPDGWAFIYAQCIDKDVATEYAVLFTVIGTTYGAGTGAEDFCMPDGRGRVVAGQDDMGGTSADRLTGTSGGVDGDLLGGTGGAETHVLIEAQMPSHTHSYTINTTGTPYTDGSGNTPFTGAGTTGSGSTGGDGAHNNVQPTIIFNMIIRYQ